MKKYLLTTLIFISVLSSAVWAQPKLSSLPSARATIFIDFDGHFIEGTIWNTQGSFYCKPAGLTPDQMTVIFHRVAEDFRPFNVNITTDSSVYLKAPLAHRIRVVVTPTSNWYPNVGGVAYTGSFTWGDDTPAFVFSDKLGFNTKYVSECISHETGHTLGLSHQARYNGSCNLIATYNDGAGNGQIGWAPVMGNSYGRNISGWNHGPTPYGCTQEQDNLSIITSRNGFTYRADDHSDMTDDTATEMRINENVFDAEGIISTNSDKDVFKFEIQQKAKVEVKVYPFSVGRDNEGANLDVKVEVMDKEGQQIALYDPEDVLHVSIDTILNRGTYFLRVSGAANANASSYGSLGSYNIQGMFSPLLVLPIAELQLSAKMRSKTHELTWQISGQEALGEIVLEKSSDGSNFSPVYTLLEGAKKFNYIPRALGKVYYRLKANSVTGREIFSNVVALPSTAAPDKSFIISTRFHTDVIVQAEEDFKFHLIDMNGRTIRKGTGNAGHNRINIGNFPNGIYFIEILGSLQQKTQRIVKL